MKMQSTKTYLIMQKLFKILGIIAMVGSVVLAIWLYKLGIMNDTNVLKDVVHRYQFWGPFIFIIVQIIQIVFPIIPGGITTVAGFLIFGPIKGFIYNYIGINLGSVILFWLVKRYGRRFIFLFVDEKTFYKYERKLETPGFENFFIFCMASPISPADVMVMIAGLSNMTTKRFLQIISWSKPLSIIGYSYLFIFGNDLIKYFFH